MLLYSLVIFERSLKQSFIANISSLTTNLFQLNYAHASMFIVQSILHITMHYLPVRFLAISNSVQKLRYYTSKFLQTGSLKKKFYTFVSLNYGYESTRAETTFSKRF